MADNFAFVFIFAVVSFSLNILARTTIIDICTEIFFIEKYITNTCVLKRLTKFIYKPKLV